MGRIARPWFNTAKKGWYVEVDYRQIPLVRPCVKNADTRREAIRVYSAMITAREQARDEGPSLGLMCDRFEDHLEQDRSESTRAKCVHWLISFVRHVGSRTPASQILPKDVTAWMAAHPKWSDNTRHTAVACVKRLYRWAHRQGHLDSDPLVTLDIPPTVRREQVMTDAQVDLVMARVRDQPFRDLLFALRESGARPIELTTLVADQVDLVAGTWTVVNKTRFATGEATRTIYLTPGLIELSRRLLAKHPRGHLFRNRLGRRWTRGAIGMRMRRLAAQMQQEGLKIGKEAVVYSLRHLYITNALERGVPPATVAELVGHKGLTMIMKIYNRLKQRTDHLREAAAAARAQPALSSSGHKTPAQV
jgi:integrase